MVINVFAHTVSIELRSLRLVFIAVKQPDRCYHRRVVIGVIYRCSVRTWGHFITMCFEIEQRFVNRADQTLTAEVVDLLSGGEEAFFEIRKNGVLERGYFGIYGNFIESWVMVGR